MKITVRNKDDKTIIFSARVREIIVIESIYSLKNEVVIDEDEAVRK